NPADATVPELPPDRPPETPTSKPLTVPTVPVLPERPPSRDPPASPKPAAATVSVRSDRLALLLELPKPEASTFRTGATGRVGDVTFEKMFVTMGGGGGAGTASGLEFVRGGGIEADKVGATGFGTGFKTGASDFCSAILGAGAVSFSTVGSGTGRVTLRTGTGGSFTSTGSRGRGGSGGTSIIAR